MRLNLDTRFKELKLHSGFEKNKNLFKNYKKKIIQVK